MNRVFLMFVALAVGTLITSSALAEPVQEEKQMGTKIAKPRDARIETWIKYQTVLSNYKYVLDEEGMDTWSLYDGTKTFRGDCEDFAFAMQALVGAGSVFPAMTHTGANGNYIPDHVVFVYAGMVWELNGEVMNIAKYQAKYAQILWYMGDVTPDMKP